MTTTESLVDRANDPQFHWVELADGTWQIPEAPAKFLDWLLSVPRDPANQEAYAKQEGLSPRTLRRWKAHHLFRREWEIRAADQNMGPEKVQAVIDNLFQIASSKTDASGVKAAALYLEHVGKYLPTTRVLQVEDSKIENMSKEALLELAGLKVLDSTGVAR